MSPDSKGWKQMWFLTRKRNLLIIDDDNSLRALTKAKLERTNQYNIFEAISVPDALESMEETDFNILLLDLHMPDSSGFEILEAMKSKKIPSIPTIIMTSEQKFGCLETALSLGAREFISKPFGTETLLSKLKSV